MMVGSKMPIVPQEVPVEKATTAASKKVMSGSQKSDRMSCRMEMR